MLFTKLAVFLHAASAATIGTRATTRQTVLQTRQDATQAPLILDYQTLTWTNGSVLDEEFYRVPPGTADKPAGSPLKVQMVVPPTNYTIPAGLSLSRIMFQSKTVNGTLAPSSAYILWPYTPREEADGYPVVAFAHGASGLQPDCAPSHQRDLFQNYWGPYPLAHQGYVVVAPDYTGLGVFDDANGQPIIHEFLASYAGANDVFYAVQAAQKTFPQLSKRFAVVGQSQGGGIAWAAAQRQAIEPVQGYLGAVAVAPANKYLWAPDAPLPTLQLILLGAALAAEQRFPEFKAEDIASERGKELLAELRERRGCLFSTGNFPDLTVPPLKPDALVNPYIRKYLDENEVGGNKISGPLLVIQGETDNLVFPNTTTPAVNETVSLYPESQLEYETFPNIGHVPSLEVSQRRWQAWLADRFAGKEVPPYKETASAFQDRPTESLQPEVNWIIVLTRLLLGPA